MTAPPGPTDPRADTSLSRQQAGTRWGGAAPSSIVRTHTDCLPGPVTLPLSASGTATQRSQSNCTTPGRARGRDAHAPLQAQVVECPLRPPPRQRRATWAVPCTGPVRLRPGPRGLGTKRRRVRQDPGFLCLPGGQRHLFLELSRQHKMCPREREQENYVNWLVFGECFKLTLRGPNPSLAGGP